MNIERKVRKTTPQLLAALATSTLLALPQIVAGQSKSDEPPPAKPPQLDRPAQDPSLTSPGSDDALLDSQKRPAAPPPIKPTRERPGQRSVPAVPQPSSNIPGLRAFDYSVPTGRFYPEGTFLLTRRGVVVQSESGEYVFVPANEAEPAKSNPVAVPTLAQSPLVLLPCQRLAQLITKVNSPADAVGVSISGQVFAYRDRQYLLLSMFTFESSGSAPDVPPRTNPSTDFPRPRATAHASADELMGTLEKRGGTPRAMGDVPTPPTSAPPAPDSPDAPKSQRVAERVASSLKTEGTVITGKRGRIVRSGGDRSIAIAIDNDPDSPSPTPMPMLPCRLLETMEALVGQRGDALAVRFSGRVTVYQGKNYLLPTMYQVVRPGDVAPMQ